MIDRFCVCGVAGQEDDHSTRMPLMLELKYEYFPNTWPGRIKLAELVNKKLLVK